MAFTRIASESALRFQHRKYSGRGTAFYKPFEEFFKLRTTQRMARKTRASPVLIGVVEGSHFGVELDVAASRSVRDTLGPFEEGVAHFWML